MTFLRVLGTTKGYLMRFSTIFGGFSTGRNCESVESLSIRLMRALDLF